MKTNTFLRWCLLIPFIIWGISLLFFLLVSIVPTSEVASGPSVSDLFTWLFAFYVFGIIIWIFPYALVALILFFLSFIQKSGTMIKLFALSPIAMTLLTLAVINILTLFDSGDGRLFTTTAQDLLLLMGFNLVLVAVIMVWGYICVGIGFGLYRFLQSHLYIKDESLIESAPQAI